MAATASTNTRNTVTSSQTTIMAYNIGGAALGLSLVDTDNSDYTANEMKQNLSSL